MEAKFSHFPDQIVELYQYWGFHDSMGFCRFNLILVNFRIKCTESQVVRRFG